MQAGETDRLYTVSLERELEKKDQGWLQLAWKTHCDFNPNLTPLDEEVGIEKGNVWV